MSKKKSLWYNGDKIVFMEKREGRLFSTYSLLAKNRFRWKNLPKELESDIIEQYLYSCGQVAFFKDDMKGGYIALPCDCDGNINIYGRPISFLATGVGYNKHLNKDEMVWIRANDELVPPMHQVEFYTNWIDEIEQTMRRNLELLRQPDIIATTKENELSMRNMYQKIKDGEEALFVETEKGYMGEIGVKVLNRNAQNYLKDLQKNKDDVMFELLTYLGINNANTSKRERMIVDEVNVNNINILMNLDVEFKNRKKACEEINKKFGLNIDVELVIDELQEKYMNTEMEIKLGKKEE